MSLPLKKIDETILHEHRSLSALDECYYLMEYMARQEACDSPGNTLIRNLKKPIDRLELIERGFKARAIVECAFLLNNALPDLVDISTCTIVPIPPSMSRANPLYDDRLLQILHYAFRGDDVRELIKCKQDSQPAHKSDHHRPSIQQLIDNYIFDENQLSTIRNNVVLFDDVLTSGNHFIACKTVIQRFLPTSRIIGTFIARRTLSENGASNHDNRH